VALPAPGRPEWTEWVWSPTPAAAGLAGPSGPSAAAVLQRAGWRRALGPGYPRVRPPGRARAPGGLGDPGSGRVLQA
jgi:hypothetical protein